MNWQHIQSLVPPPGKAPDYQNCLEAFPVLELAKTTPQSPVYHGEGDVWTHTKMVVDALLEQPDYLSANQADREVMFLAALLHDVAKYSTTVIDPQSGAITQPGHSKRGAVDTRVLLWDAGAPFEQREAICRMIQVHQVPFYVMGDSRSKRNPEFTVRELSWQLNIKHLSAIAEADIRGRICPDAQSILDNIELFRELAREEACYEAPRKFADAHTRVSYFNGADVHPDYALFQEKGSNVTVMCGLPASGKDTWVAQNASRLPVVSFDDAREELGLRHGQNDGKAAHFAIDKAKEHLREKAPFVWNATHLTRQMREKTLGLLYAYGAEVRIVYLEQSRKELLRRNTKRDSTLPNKVLEAMVTKWEVPVPTEGHQMEYYATMHG